MLFKRQNGWIVYLSLFLGVVTGLIVSPGHAATVNYQGRLAGADGTALNGPVNLIFFIYNDPTAGNLLWQESRTVTADEGIFSVNLGADVPFPDDLFEQAPLYLQIVVTGPDGPEILTPRQEVTATALAVLAEKSRGLTSGALTTAMIDEGAVTGSVIAGESIDSHHLVQGAVNSDKIQDGSVSDSDVAFNYAGAATKGGPALDLDCEGCVSATQIQSPLGLSGSSPQPVIQGTNAGSGAGVWGANGNGSYGYLGGSGAGVYGRGADGTSGWLGSPSYGVYGANPDGYAGFFAGDVGISGAGKGIVFPDGSRQTGAGAPLSEVNALTSRVTSLESPQAPYVEGRAEFDGLGEINFSELYFGASLPEVDPDVHITGRASFDNVRLTVPADSPLLPLLMLKVADGAEVDNVDIFFQENLLLELRDVQVAKLDYLHPAQNAPATCEIELRFTQITFTWKDNSIAWNLETSSGSGSCSQDPRSFIDIGQYSGDPSRFTDEIIISWFGFGAERSEPTVERPELTKVAFSNIEVIMELNEYSTCFLSLLTNGRHLGELSIEKWVDRDRKQLDIQLKDVLVTGFKFSPAATGSPQVRLAVRFGEIELIHTRFDEQGRPVQTVFGWDVYNNIPN